MPSTEEIRRMAERAQRAAARTVRPTIRFSTQLNANSWGESDDGELPEDYEPDRFGDPEPRTRERNEAPQERPVNLGDDLVRMYNGSYLGRIIGDNLVPIQVREIRMMDDGQPHFIIQNSKGEVERVTRKELNFEVPKLGFVNVGLGCAYLKRVPARQWRRGLTNGLVEFGYPNYDEWAPVGAQSTLSWDVLASIYDKGNLPSPDQALERVFSGQYIGAAFHRKFAYVIRVGYSTPLLAYKEWPVGRVSTDGSVTLVPEAAHLVQELSKYVRAYT